ncbi:hypothetical protein CFC35_35925 [Streptomyces sp. FBKL.4005]|nr:hypothetical protein CFC35_35925 [Streptomyces sp. FBKL.4005]
MRFMVTSFPGLNGEEALVRAGVSSTAARDTSTRSLLLPDGDGVGEALATPAPARTAKAAAMPAADLVNALDIT